MFTKCSKAMAGLRICCKLMVGLNRRQAPKNCKPIAGRDSVRATGSGPQGLGFLLVRQVPVDTRIAPVRQVSVCWATESAPNRLGLKQIGQHEMRILY